MCDAVPLEPRTYSRDVHRSCDVGQRCPLPRYMRKCLFSKGIWSPRHNYGAATPAAAPAAAPVAAPAAAPAAATEDPLDLHLPTEHQMNSLFKTFASNLQDIADNKFMSKKMFRNCLNILSNML